MTNPAMVRWRTRLPRAAAVTGGMFALGLAGLSSWLFLGSSGRAGMQDAISLPLPPGAHIVLPPDRIPAVDRPRFVPATNARVQPDSPMILLRGKGEVRAHSLPLLDRHEIVNDQLEGEPIAVTW